ncbi:MAG: glutamate--tRNA ligase [Pseudomonadota bacterium]
MGGSAAAQGGGIVARFAPSPTGFLHIGGARTALFNWLFAKAQGGRFLLRIEDTDRARSTPEATEAIYEGLRWLELDWDGEAVSQAARIERHRAAAEAMLASGAAYRCYASKEEIDAARAAAAETGAPPIFESPWRDRDPQDAPSDAPFVVRLRAPREGETVIEDAVQGRVSWRNETLDDLILLRSDGTPTYMLAVVVDDHEMGASHVIRGDDHLTNAARQSLIFDALGWRRPIFAHIPLIHGQDGAKLSKRHGALGVEAYRAMGFLPEAMRNYLARLGWSHGDEEIFTTAQAVEWFSLDAVNKGASRFDLSKLTHVNAQHMKRAAPERLLSAVETLRAAEGAAPYAAEARARLLAAAEGVKTRAKTLLDFQDLAAFALAERPISFDEKSRTALTDEALVLIRQCLDLLETCEDWSQEALDAIIRDFAVRQGVKMGAVAQPLRAALTGQAVSPGAFDVMLALGRDETLGRLRDALALEA